jgi:hypothetical protein
LVPCIFLRLPIATRLRHDLPGCRVYALDDG